MGSPDGTRPLAVVTGASSGIGVSVMPVRTDLAIYDGVEELYASLRGRILARQGFEALMAGKDKVVAGSLKNKVQAGASKLLSETTRAKMHGSMSEPGSGRG